MTAPFIPPRRTLMGPGPSDVPQRVLDAMARPTIGHLDPAFVELMEEIKAMLRMAFRTQNTLTFPVSAPGSAGMETCFVNLVEPVNPMYGLHESLVMLEEEGLDNAWAHHRAMHERLKAGLEDMGLGYVAAEPARLPQLNAIHVPEGTDEAAIRARLLDEFNLEIGAALGDKAGRIWRIGLMGHSARQENIDLCLDALRACLR